MKTVTKIDPCYEKLVNEFIVNIQLACNNEENPGVQESACQESFLL